MSRYVSIIPMAVIVLMLMLSGCGGSSGPSITVNITSPTDGATVDPTFSVTVNASTEEEGGSITGIAVTVNGQTENIVGATGTVNFTITPDGDYTITAVATDDQGRTKTERIEVTVETPPTDPPTVTIDDPANNAGVLPNFSVTVTGTPVEPGATITKVDVTVNGVTKTVTGPTGTVNFTSVPDGTRTITAVATDSFGVTGTATINVTVDSADPTVVISSPANGATVQDNMTVTCTATAQEATATIQYIDVTFGGSTQRITGATGSKTFDTTAVTNGSRSVTAVATDSYGKTATTSITVTVNNPIPFNVFVDSQTVSAGSTVNIPIKITDATGIAGFDMGINYPVGALTGISVAKGAAIPSSALIISNSATAGRITVSIAGTEAFTAGEGTLVTITATAGAAGVRTIDIDAVGTTPSLQFFNTAGNAINPQPTAVDGTVTIN